MVAPGVLVVGETASLGRSIVDLLESGGVPHRLVSAIDAELSLARLSDRFPVVVAACNKHRCVTARRWVRGEFPGVALVVVGDRDVGLPELPGVRVVPLPLLPNRFLMLVRSLLTTAELSGHPTARSA